MVEVCYSDEENGYVSTETIQCATGLGTALFAVLFMYVKVPTRHSRNGHPDLAKRTPFFAVLFGPIAGGLIAFIGHALSWMR